MAKVKLLVSRAANVGGEIVSQLPRTVIDVDDAEAARMIDAGQAEPADARSAVAKPPKKQKPAKPPKGK